MPILTTIKPLNPKACQKADWKRHKKVCDMHTAAKG